MRIGLGEFCRPFHAVAESIGNDCSTCRHFLVLAMMPCSYPSLGWAARPVALPACGTAIDAAIRPWIMAGLDTIAAIPAQRAGMAKYIVIGTVDHLHFMPGALQCPNNIRIETVFHLQGGLAGAPVCAP